ncbi:CBBY-like protein isoform X2 [Macadamia integrifolia]|uniref:CBBY-like protein isoform X2 n=1 Tax=Macadamia integrifolia TaxID=60698 RepID=UPI001C529714|nr:CBBY-like protein isoform X2 [Macadamia integrifolia]
MDSASCSILYTLSLSRIQIPKLNRTFLHSIPSFASTSERNFRFCGKNLHFNRVLASNSSSNPIDENPSQPLAVILEVEGVLMDVYRLGNRQAFNVAFQKHGLDCANWTEPIYVDLSRKAGGDEKMMLVLYFNRIGWPTSLPTNEKETFMKSVLREKKNALEEFVMAKSLPLRPGIENFIDDALHNGIPVVIVTAYDKSCDKMSRSIIEKLGNERVSKIRTVGKEEVEQSLYGQLVFGEGVTAGLDEQLAKEAIKAASAEKQRIAEEVASVLKLKVEIDTSSTERQRASGTDKSKTLWFIQHSKYCGGIACSSGKCRVACAKLCAHCRKSIRGDGS